MAKSSAKSNTYSDGSKWSSFSRKSGGYFPKGTQPSTKPNYNTWTWKQIEAAICGGSELSGTQGDAAAKNFSDPATMQQAAMSLEFVRQVLNMVSQSLQDQANALAGGSNPPWKGPAADAFLDNMSTYSQQVNANAQMLNEPPTISSTLPQQLMDQATNLAVSIAKIEAIDNWYANIAATQFNVSASNGLVPIHEVPGLAEMMTNTMLPVLTNLANQYEVTYSPIQAVNPTFDNLNNGGTSSPPPGSKSSKSPHSNSLPPPPNANLSNINGLGGPDNSKLHLPGSSNLHIPGVASMHLPKSPAPNNLGHLPSSISDLPNLANLGNDLNNLRIPGLSDLPGDLADEHLPSLGNDLNDLRIPGLSDLSDGLADEHLPSLGDLPRDLEDGIGGDLPKGLDDNVSDPALHNLEADPFDEASSPSSLTGAESPEEAAAAGESPYPYIPGMGGLGQGPAGAERSDSSGLLGGEDEPWRSDALADEMVPGAAAGGQGLVGMESPEEAEAAGESPYPYIPGMGGLGQGPAGAERSDSSGLLGGEDEPWLEEGLEDIIVAGAAAGGAALARMHTDTVAEGPAADESADEDEALVDGEAAVSEAAGLVGGVPEGTGQSDPQEAVSGEDTAASAADEAIDLTELGPAEPGMTGTDAPGPAAQAGHDAPVLTGLAATVPPGETMEDIAAWDTAVAGAVVLMSADTRADGSDDPSDDSGLARWRPVPPEPGSARVVPDQVVLRAGGGGYSQPVDEAQEQEAEAESASSGAAEDEEPRRAATLLAEDASQWGTWQSDTGALG